MPAAVYRKRELIVTRRIDDEVILVPIKRGAGDLEHIFRLSEVGAFLWERIDGRRDAESLAEEVLEAFEAEPVSVRQDVPAFLAELAENGLVEPIPAP